ncbi:hypothetical protein AQUCO_00500465v1 [Aquilegia coerulea]|uniref:SWIM-type domain-containing protein n=1 Tax=Aquilegia coerulea TaxID=218851 RepID=A0A2G5ES34_AQUCA|nr:hypothetical protein AQUCO_00500465v1 [Aquilegia coerulea]
MARWDKILSLPIQSPPTFEFSAADLEWSKVEGWFDKIEKVAFIPFDRVDNFLSGESANKDFPTRFYKEAGRKINRSSTSKEKVDGVIEFTMYRCAFGPDDRREGGSVRPSRNTYIRKKKSSGRPSIKRGCQCYFFVKRLVAKPMAALIIYKQDKHVDKKGLPCHGPQDARAVGTKAMFSPYMSDDLRSLVISLIHIGFSVETVMHIRNELIEKEQEGPFSRDDLLTHRNVRRLERSIRRSKYDLDEDDAVSIEMWSDKHENDIFFREDYSDSEPFILGIQTEWQLQQMIKFGNNSLMASDSRFGTNKLKYPVHSLLVFDSDKKAIPVAWIIAPQSAIGDAYKWIRALHRKVHSKNPEWKLAGFIVDDPLLDVLTIREVFQCSVLISFWRVRHAWHKNIMEKCLEVDMRSEMLGRLGKAIYSICKGKGNVDLFESFMEDFIDCSDFMDYFRAIWFPRIGMWTAALKSLPFTSQETCSAMESYHHKLKLMFSNEDANVYQRADWLIDKLYTKVHSCFFLDEYPGKKDFARYTKVKWMSGLTSWERASEIPDSDVVLENNNCAKVISQRVREKAHVVWNPGSEFALCDCDWSGMGNLCKHVIKVNHICRRKISGASSISLFKYNQTLVNMLHIPAHDSLIRDHAVTLAVCIQDALKKHIVGASSTGSLDGVIEGECSMEQLVTPLERTSGIQAEAQDGVAVHINGEDRIDQVAKDNGFHGETVGQMIGCSDDMDVDPVSICLSPSEFRSDGLFSTDGGLGKENRHSLNARFDLSESLPSDVNLSTDGSLGREDRDTLNAGLGLSESFSSSNDSYIQDYISDREFRDDMISKGVCVDVLEGTLVGSMMDVDPPPIQLPMFRCEIH